MNNNPVRYSDPSGHCVLCSFGLKVLAAWSFGTTSYLHQVVSLYVDVYLSKPYSDTKGENVFELMRLAYQREPNAEITGAALDAIATDKNLLRKENELIGDIVGNPNYGKKPLSGKTQWPSLTFGEMGNNNMLEDALQSQTWTVRAADVAVNYSVTSGGDITIDYKVTDTLDLRPQWDSEARAGMSGFFYNVVTTVLGAYWHDCWGASEMKTEARWRKNIPAIR